MLIIIQRQSRNIQNGKKSDVTVQLIGRKNLKNKLKFYDLFFFQLQNELKHLVLYKLKIGLNS